MASHYVTLDVIIMTTFSSQRQSPDVAQVEQRLLDIFNILGTNILLNNCQALVQVLVQTGPQVE